MSKSDQKTGLKTVADNRKARFHYEIVETYEAGIALTGTEVKSLRFGEASIAESYAAVEGDELWLINSHVPEYSHGNRLNHHPRRPRKLLLRAGRSPSCRAPLRGRG